MNSNPPPDGDAVLDELKATALSLQKRAQNTLPMFQYLILLLALVFAGWLVCKILVFGISLWVSPAELTIMPFDGGETAKKQAPAILSAKLRELKTRGKLVPTGYGLLTVPQLESGPQQTEQAADSTLGDLDKIQLKIKDVDVSALIRAFDNLLTPARYELRGSVVELPTSLSVICQLVRREKVIASWEATTKTSTADTPSSAAPKASATLEDLLDQVLYQIVFDFANNSELKDEWKISLSRAESFANWQSLRAYVRGLRALRSYQESLDPHDLQEASQFFDSLAISDPSNPYGLYFRGLALSEDRREAEAVETFGQLQRLLKRQAGLPGSQAMLREARLNEATARLKLYTMDQAKKAVMILESLCEELEKELKELDENAKAKAKAASSASPAASQTMPGKQDSTNAPDDSYTRKLLSLCYAQLAHTHATILSFRELKETRPPEWVTHRDARETSLKKAEEAFKSVGEKWGSHREKMDVRFRIENARGYGLYRQAHFEDASLYAERCNNAIESLERADQARPNHYAVLQNLGMIYADKTFDPEGDSLPEAQRLFERTKKFVPNDYYQYEQLAKIHERLLEACSTDACRTAEIEAGRKEANEAIRLRRKSAALDSLLVFAVKEWEMKRTEATATAGLTSFKDAMPARQEDAAFQQQYVAFLKELAETRKSMPTGLLEIVERSVALAQLPKLEAERRNELVTFAVQQADNILGLTQDPAKPENKDLHARAEELRKQAEQIAGRGP